MKKMKKVLLVISLLLLVACNNDKSLKSELDHTITISGTIENATKGLVKVSLGDKTLEANLDEAGNFRINSENRSES